VINIFKTEFKKNSRIPQKNHVPPYYPPIPTVVRVLPIENQCCVFLRSILGNDATQKPTLLNWLKNCIMKKLQYA